MTNPTEHAKAAMPNLLEAIMAGIVLGILWCIPLSGCTPQSKVDQWPVQHATEALQQCFDAMGEPIDASKIDVAFWGRTYSQVPDANTVRFSSTRLWDYESCCLEKSAAMNACHEAAHVVQAQGRRRLGWWWYYIWNRGRLEREADEMAERYWEAVR